MDTAGECKVAAFLLSACSSLEPFVAHSMRRSAVEWNIMPVGRESVLECASVLALFVTKHDCQLESAKTLAHSKTLSRYIRHCGHKSENRSAWRRMRSR
jgi:hypothetical protein